MCPSPHWKGARTSLLDDCPRVQLEHPSLEERTLSATSPPSTGRMVHPLLRVVEKDAPACPAHSLRYAYVLWLGPVLDTHGLHFDSLYSRALGDARPLPPRSALRSCCTRTKQGASVGPCESSGPLSRKRDASTPAPLASGQIDQGCLVVLGRARALSGHFWHPGTTRAFSCSQMKFWNSVKLYV